MNATDMTPSWLVLATAQTEELGRTTITFIFDQEFAVHDIELLDQAGSGALFLNLQCRIGPVRVCILPPALCQDAMALNFVGRSA